MPELIITMLAQLKKNDLPAVRKTLQNIKPTVGSYRQGLQLKPDKSPELAGSILTIARRTLESLSKTVNTQVPNLETYSHAICHAIAAVICIESESLLDLKSDRNYLTKERFDSRFNRSVESIVRSEEHMRFASDCDLPYAFQFELLSAKVLEALELIISNEIS